MSTETPELVAGRYRIGEVIGRGATGSVFRAVDTSTGETVAIKVLDPHVADEAPAMLERFQTEGRILGELRHPSVVRLVEVVEQGGRHYLVMEHVPGGSLRDLLLRESRLPLKRAVEIGLDLADALACAHDAGVLHRDIKPSNILLADDGTPRLSDFGVALLAARGKGAEGPRGRGDAAKRRTPDGEQPMGGDQAGSTTSTITSTSAQGGGPQHSSTPSLRGGDAAGRVGTLAYMSPEAFRGETQGPAGDVWSLGMVLYEMVAGVLPFEQERGRMGAGTESPVPLVATFRRDAPEEMVSLLREMLERDPDQRLRDCAEVATRLEAILHGMESGDRESVAEAGAFPEYVTPFVGRERETEQLVAWLRDPAHRVVSLTGVGGVGKSRLAVEVASRLRAEFADGVWLVPLAGVSSPQHVLPAVARSVGLVFRGVTDPTTQLLSFLGPKDLLLVLDNFEHLLGGVPLLEDVLDRAPGVKLLVTSRERLNIQGERRFELAGLPVPDDQAHVPQDYGSVELFLAGARKTLPGFTPSDEEMSSVMRVCGLVAGIPLAIELAAAWVGSRSCAEIAEAIELNVDDLVGSRADLPERHRTLRAVFDHSWRLLHDAEQTAFARLSVFRGGFTLDAARRVVGAPLALLRALMDKSLLRTDAAGRYDVHELLRQYADEELRNSVRGLLETAALHADYYANFVHQREADVRRGDTAVLASIDADIDNVRLAWVHRLEHGSPGDIASMLDSLRPYQEARSLFTEGEDLSRQGVESLRKRQPRSAATARSLGTALANRAGFLHRLGWFQEALSPAQEALGLLRDTGSQAETAFAANVLGIAHLCLGDYTSAERVLTEALSLFEASGDLRGMATVLNSLGTVAHEKGEVDNEKDLRERTLEVCRRAAYERGVRSSLYNLGVLHLELGNPEGACATFHECLELCRQVGDRRGEAMAQMNTAYAEALLGHRKGVSERLEQARATLGDLGDRIGVVDVLLTHGEVYLIWKHHARAKELFQEALELTEETGRAWHRVGAPACLAEVTRILGEYDTSIEWYREAVECGTRFGIAVKVAQVLVGFAQLVLLKGDDREKALRAVLVALRTSATGASAGVDPHVLVTKLEAELTPGAVEAARAWAESGPPNELARRLVAEDT